MRFGEKLKFFVFGGCFVALGVALTYLADIKADEPDFGEIKIFDTIACNSLAILDKDDKPRIYLNAINNTPMVTMVNTQGNTEFSLSGGDPELPAAIIIGNIEKLHTQVSPNGIMKRRDRNVISRWP